MTSKRSIRYICAAVVLGLVALIVPTVAHAQSPNPNVYFEDWRPGNLHFNTTGNVIEDLGSINCPAYNMYNAINDTVNSLNHGWSTLTEVSPQTVCGSLSQYETWIADVNYIVNASTSQAGRFWGGIMVDEEPTWAPESWYVSLNSYLNNAMLNTPGAEWWYNEIGPCNNGSCYSQAQYNQLLSDSWSSPQVYNSNFAAYANHDGIYEQMVTTWAGASYPYNSYSYAASVIGGTPYNSRFGGTQNFQWENIYQNQ